MKNIKTIHFPLFTALLFNSAAYAEDTQTSQLEQIDVEDKITETSNYKMFKQAAASSSKEQVYKSTASLDETIRSMPGAFTQQDKSSGTLSLNIRGDSGFGRANSMIDGVVQTFYASATDGNNRSGGSSQFGAVLDANFIAGVDLTKGTFDGKNGLNSLNGSANFRTLGVNDVVKVGDKFGILTKGAIGNNQSKYDYMATAAYRQELNNGGYLGILYGISKRAVSQNYKIGGGRKISSLGVDILNAIKRDDFLFSGLKETPNGWSTPSELEESCLKSYGESCLSYFEKVWQETSKQYDTTPFDADALRQKSQSHLAKIEYADNYNILNLQYRVFNNLLAGRKIENKTYQLNYNFSLGDLTDLNLLYSHNSAKQKYPKGSLFSGREVKDYLQANNISDTLDINNHFSFSLPKNITYDLTLGANLLINEYSKNRFPEEFGLFYGLNEIGDKAILPRTSSIFQPSGKQKFTTFYIDNHLAKDIFNLNYNVNFVNYRFNGEYANYFIDYEDYVGHYSENEILKNFCDKELSLDGQTYYYYCALHEAITKKSGKRNNINHSLVLNADIHELFNPFISYSKTHRMPNIQEMFFSQIGTIGVNTKLKPEQAQTYQIGFNSAKEGLFSDNDRFGLKLVFYRSKIKDYIHNVYGFWGSEPPDWSKINSYLYTVHFQNYRRPVRKKGLELELSYDNSRFFANLSYAYQKSNQPTSFGDAGPDNIDDESLDQVYGLSKISMLPKDYGRLELGTRWFDQKLTLATVARYYGKSKRATIEDEYLYGSHQFDDYDANYLRTRKTEEINKQPIIFDFYISYEPIKDLIIKAELINAFDKRYIDPLDSNNDSASQRYYQMESGDTIVLNNFARGRTARLSLSYKF
ncbi:hemoglobin/transferrin/lactoferrin receptor protein [Cricetibacter osteomyelitidis]|uniref:Hemoglobin/transferrin/lactoferrin receptor protein n=1 Tax=Cricetibacter osteomyelitidis TaxID=1521931 RepID=A0A4R2T3V9_9PAST|nr:TonB-dependent receptor [Cricetibacter osteomyelitidis]TCP97649.1 hemoglobin/transferrin/lactoferrin receptor protein [Cricetibacter osteomyelitidis]